MRWAGHVICMGPMKNSYKILVIAPEGKRALLKPKYRNEYYIKLVKQGVRM
jgi:hypothetical protein